MNFIAESDSDSDGDDRPEKSKKKVLKSSFAQAFQSIINKKVEDKVAETEGPILAKYKRPAKEVNEEKKRDNELRLKKIEKERIRIMGRRIPTANDEEKERELQIIATRGGNFLY